MIEYDEEILKKINEEANLIEYVSQTVDLEKRGDDYYTNCPKHVDFL